MIIVINSQGGLVSQQNEDLFQGSTGANVINLIAPFATNVIFKAVFEMPDGSYKPDIDGYMFEPTIQVVDGLNVWRLIVNFPITQYSGLVKMQLRGIVGDKVVCTTSVKFSVQEGVPYESSYIEKGTYDYLFALISDLRGLLNDKVNIKKYAYKQVEVSDVSIGTYYVFDAEQNAYIAKILPNEYEYGVQYFEIASESMISNENGLYLQFTDNELGQIMRLDVKGDKVTINDSEVISGDDLIAENVAFDSTISGLGVNNVQDAVDKLKTSIDSVQSSQLVVLGERILSASAWVENAGVWEYEFKDALYTSSTTQDLILTPTKATIDLLNTGDILIYPKINSYQESEDIAVGIIQADKKPEIDLVFDVKIQSTTLVATSAGVRAGQIVFSETASVPKQNVQEAIVYVQNNIDTFRQDYDTEKAGFAKLGVDGKVPASQLPSYVDDVIECYIVPSSTPYSVGWLTLEQYGTALTPEANKIYLVIEDGDYANRQYRWSGSQYVIISESLALGEVSGTAYEGSKGKQNADAIAQLQSVVNAGFSMTPITLTGTTQKTLSQSWRNFDALMFCGYQENDSSADFFAIEVPRSVFEGCLLAEESYNDTGTYVIYDQTLEGVRCRLVLSFLTETTWTIVGSQGPNMDIYGIKY